MARTTDTTRAARTKSRPGKRTVVRRTRAAKESRRKAAAAGGRQVRVRMYDVGFGDAFLVEIPDKSGTQRILFDCGSIQASPTGGAMKQIVNRIIADVTDSDGNARIDVVVATHRHKDHISGFAVDGWDAVEVQEVWMPWTEHPTDEDARRIRDVQSRMALALNASMAALAVSPDAQVREDVDRYRGMVENALMLTNDREMKRLHGGFAGNPKRRFLPTNTEPRSFETPALPGVRVHVLGPSRDKDIIRDMDPPKGESFLRMHSGVQTADGLPPPPFTPEFVDASGQLANFLTDLDIDELHKAGVMSELAVAVALDKAVNGTSLMIILEIAGSYFLFPGDAQWGTWQRAMQDPEWQEMLKKLSFYKIGHHGSHNATPASFVRDLFPVGCCAMASTLVRKVWPDIPRAPLLTALARDKKAKIARSDEPVDKTSFRVDNGVVEAHIAI